MIKRLLGLALAVFISLIAGAHDFADSTQKTGAGNRVPEKFKSPSSLEELTQFLNRDAASIAMPAGFDPGFFDKSNEQLPAGILSRRDSAIAAINELESLKNFIAFLDPTVLHQLPIGFVNKVGNSEVTIAISSVTFTPRYAELTVFARLKIPQAPKEIFFGVSGLKLSNNGGIIGDAKLVLLGDVTIPINGNNAALILKGSMDASSGQANNLTNITIDCNGFKNFGIAAEIKFPRTLLVPVDTNGNQLLSGNVVGSFTIPQVLDWNNILAEHISLPRFEIVGLKGIAFNVADATFDQSDFQNSNGISYPSGYQDKYLVPGNPNLWRGFYARTISVTLPKAFKDRTSNGPVSFGVNDLLIDNNGFSGNFFAQNVLPITRGSASGWKFSVDSIRLSIEANHLLAAGFGGKLGLPVTATNDYDTTNKSKFLAYQAFISSGSDYTCRVTTLDSLNFDIWKARVSLMPNSYVQLSGNAEALRPEAMLHGSMSILSRSYDTGADRPAGKNPVADMKGIEFRYLNIKTEAPYISAQSFGFPGEIKVANFPVSVSNIALESSGNETALAFNLKVGLDENFGGETRLKLIGQLSEGDGLQSWSYNRLSIDAISLHASINNSFDLNGTLQFMNDDPVYGDGFQGAVNARFGTVLKGLEVAVDTKFGKLQSYRYWSVDGKVKLPTPVQVGAGFEITGFSGGAYFRMKKETTNANIATNSGVSYTPDSTAGLGVKAGILFNWGSKKAATGEASFEVAFNRGGGMRYAGLFGFVHLMKDMHSGVTDLGEAANNVFKRVEDLARTQVADSARLNTMKMQQPSYAAKECFPTAGNEQPGAGLSAYLGIQYDFNASTLHGNFELYINAAGGLIRGTGSGNRAGWAVVHIAPESWYLHVGTPTDRIGVNVGIGSLRINTGAYFMVGDNLPGFPDPPSVVTNLLGENSLQYRNSVDTAAVRKGQGLAFGANVGINTGDLRFLMFYANFQAGIGFDVMFANNAICNGTPAGINGWFAQGQAYAYLQGELGIRIKIFMIKKNIRIIKAGAAALLYAKIPNPTFIKGDLGFKVDILNGLIKGSFTFGFKFGEDCLTTQGEADRDYDDFQVITAAAPAHQSTGVNVLTPISMNFKMVPGQPMTLETDNGNEYIYPKLEYFKVVKSSAPANSAGVEGTFQTADGGKTLLFAPAAMLDPNTQYKIMAKVTFQEYKYNSWVDLTDNGQRVEEIKEYSFTTGNLPDTIEYSLIERMYPFFNERNLYKEEPRNGVITLTANYTPVFASAPGWKARFVAPDGTVAGETAVTYSAQKLAFGFPTLAASTTYKLQVIATDAATVLRRPLITYSFTTSQYGTLAEKVQAIQFTQPVIGRVSSDVINLQAQVNSGERFEIYELIGNKYTGAPLVQAEAVLSDSYYQDSIRPLIYPGFDNAPNPVMLTDGQKNFYLTNRTPSVLGTPPYKAISILPYYLSELQGGGYSSFTTQRMPFVYDLPRIYSRDFNDLRTQVVNYYLASITSSNTYCYEEKYLTPTKLTYKTAVINDGFSDPYDSPSYLSFDDGVTSSGTSTYCQTVVTTESLNYIPPQFQRLVTRAFPFMSTGSYKIKLKLRLPDGTYGSNNDFNFQNPIQ